MMAQQVWVGMALAHFVWEGAAIAAVFAIGLALMRQASSRSRYALACGALLAMPVAFGITLAVLMPHSGVRFVAPLVAFDVARAEPVTAGPASWSWNFQAFLAWAAPLWLAGVALFMLYRFASWIAAQKLRRLGTCAAPEEWTRRFESLVARLEISRGVRLLESYLAEVPMAIGYLRPLVLVPIGMLANLPADQVEAILLHELAHIHRADYLVNLVQAVVESVLFYHPAVWWISKVVREERENCCDDFVIARDTDRRAYAAALVALEQGRANVLIPAATSGNLLRRVRRMLTRQESTVGVAPVLLAILVASVVFAAWQPTIVKPTSSTQSRVLPVAIAPSNNQIVITQHLVAQAQPERRPKPSAKPVFDRYARWIGEDVRYIIASDERRAWGDLKTDAEREDFIKQFWERRDPTPGTPQNEYRDEHYRRIAYSNERFAFAGHPGWFTDRGRIYVLYGPPDEIESHLRGEGNRPHAVDNWRYRYIEGMGYNIFVEFIDLEDNGGFEMAGQPADPQQIRGRMVQTIQFFEDELRVARQKYGEDHPDVRALMTKLILARDQLRAYDQRAK